MGMTTKPPFSEHKVQESSSRIIVSRRIFAILAIAVVLIGAGLRLPRLATRSLWYDEAVSANNASGSLTETLMNTRNHNSSPILYPALLWAVGKLDHSALSMRLPAFASSIMLIILVIVVGRKFLGSDSALLAGLLVALTPSQIHYAREAREYALSGLFACLMTFAYIDFELNPGGRAQKLRLYATLALAPLIQYGLVLFGAAILCAMAWKGLAERRFRLLDMLFASASIGLTGLFSLLFTLRYQFKSSAGAWYLEEAFFTPGKMSLIKYVYHNGTSLLSFLCPGWIAGGLVAFGLAAVLVLTSHEDSRALRRLLVCSGCIALLAGLAHFYPFGGVRQCLYLGALVSVAGAVGIREIWRPLAESQTLRCIGIITAIVCISGFGTIISSGFYREKEDSQAILARLTQENARGDDVYVYYGARPAVEFYLGRPAEPAARTLRMEVKWFPFYEENTNGRHFIYGGVHQDQPHDYVRELLRAVMPTTERLWLVFSHIQPEDDRLIIDDLRAAGWSVTESLRATDAILFQAKRGST
jgi:uncharacterized membrane protein